MMWKRPWSIVFLVILTIVASAPVLLGQTDQGTITGVVQDPTGAVIGNASVTLVSPDTGLTLKSKADAAGVYVFSPIKIGNYSITVAAPGFETTTQANLHLSIQQRLNVVITLKPGATSETVTVTTEAPLLQTQESSVGQTMSTETIDSVPLNGRNWVYIAQLAPGAAPPTGSRGAGKGDFQANGQRAEQNNFILDGVDNNVNVVDFYNGASFVAQPPPDALQEFKVQTSNYSAEFGHSAGAVLNASLKSGTNAIHGNLWEYVRNTVFDTHDWGAAAGSPVPNYHENQFGATLGFPVIKNKLFLFGDAQANRISFQESGYYTVPTEKMRAGDFSELLNPALTGNPAQQLYYQGGEGAPVPFANNCVLTGSSCTSSVQNVPYSEAALNLLSAFPAPNAGNGVVYNNYYSLRPIVDNTFQWDARADWNIGAKDNTYSRYSYWNEVGNNAPPLGYTVDGGGFGDDGKQKIYGANFMWSETHVFNPTLTNEVRFAFNYLHTGFQHPNAANPDFADSIGFGGIPKAELNGGLPRIIFDGNNSLSQAGSPEWSTTDEHQNVYQILDNVTKIWGNHALKAGVSFQNIRFSTLQPQFSRGEYHYNGNATANLTAGGSVVANTGNSIADFLLDRQNNGGLSNEVTNGDQRMDNAVYFQDDWRVKPSLTLNLGLRWEYFQPYQDVGGYQASFNMTGPMQFDTTTGTGSGSAQYLIPKETFDYAMGIINSPSYSPNYGQVLAADNIKIVSVPDPHLLKAQKTNFAPRIGAAWSVNNKTVVRAGFGIFYGGLESLGYWPNLGENYPFQFTGTFPAASCTGSTCPGNGITIPNGYSSIIAAGFASNVTGTTMRGSDPEPKTPYTESYNLAIERSITNDIVATIAYVGNVSKHLQVNVDANAPLALAAYGVSSQPFRPLPHEGGSAYVSYSADSQYNSLQAKIEKRMSHGWNLLGTYTWAHALDDGNTPLGSSGDAGQQNYNLIPIKNDWSQSAFDTRQRFTFNALYEFPFGKGKAYLNSSTAADIALGGWSTNLTFVAQTGNYFTVYPSDINTASGGSARAVRIGDQYATGGTSAVGGKCATSVRNSNNWYNPCSFTNPWDPTDPAGGHYLSTGPLDNNVPKATPDYVTDTTNALGYLGGRRDAVSGPGYNRINMSIFKEFKTWREQNLEFRTDIFNLFNTPALANPSNTGIGTNGGLINGTRGLQKYAPDSRFFQLSLRYNF
jgi:hypothetical protein